MIEELKKNPMELARAYAIFITILDYLKTKDKKYIEKIKKIVDFQLN